jgi:hypothetical protein
MMDFEWLGVGRIRFGFFAYGKIQYCHQITNINILDSPYVSCINLPLRYELIGSSVNTAFIKQICSTVISEGGYSPIGRPFGISSTSGISVAATEVPILALKGGSINYFHQNIIPIDINILDSTQNNTNLWTIRLYYGTDISNIGATWADVNTSFSVSQYATTFSGWNSTNSIIIAQGLFSGKGTITFGDLSSIFSDQVVHITSDINSLSDAIVLTCERINGSSASNVYATMNISESY